MCMVSFISFKSKMRGGIKKNLVLFFSIKLCLCDKVNFGLVKDSFCCNEISDKLIIKQTYIISLNTFLWLIHCYMVQFFPGLQFICFSALFHLGLGSSFPQNHWNQSCVSSQSRFMESETPLSLIHTKWTFQFANCYRWYSALVLKSWMHGVEFTWFIVNSPIPAATMFICCWMCAFSI